MLWEHIPQISESVERYVNFYASVSDILLFIAAIITALLGLRWWRKSKRAKRLAQKVSPQSAVASINYLTGQAHNRRLYFDTLLSWPLEDIFHNPDLCASIAAYILDCKKTQLVDLGEALQGEAMTCVENALSGLFPEAHLKAASGNGDDREPFSVAMQVEVYANNAHVFRKLKIITIKEGEEEHFANPVAILQLKRIPGIVKFDFYLDRFDSLNIVAVCICKSGAHYRAKRMIGSVLMPTK